MCYTNLREQRAAEKERAMKTTKTTIESIIREGWSSHDEKSPLREKLEAIDYQKKVAELAELGYSDESDVRWAMYELLADRLDYNNPDILRIQLLLLS